MQYTITHNAQFNSTEVTFSGKPSEPVRDALKALRFRWHSQRHIWYGYASEEAAQAAIDAAENGKSAPIPEKTTAPRANSFGVNVGDLFVSTWGYDQTNNDFFQVIALVGEKFVRVREVCPVCEDAESVSWASENRTICTDTAGKLLPPKSFSVFIKDQEQGDLKRLKSYAADGVSNPFFSVSSFANAHLCTGSTVKVYESWYA